MSAEEKKSLRRQIQELDRERQLKMQELMKEYDRTYYYPKRKEIQDKCLEHDWEFQNHNGFYHAFFRCRHCDASKSEKTE